MSSSHKIVMSTEPPRTCYIAGAMSSVPVEKRPELRKKREAIATFFRDGYSIICSHYKVLYAEPESGPTSNPEHAEPESGPTSNPEHAEPESGPTSNPEHAEPESGPTSNPEHAEPESVPTSNPEHAEPESGPTSNSEHAEPESGPTSNPEHAEPESVPTSNPEHAEPESGPTSNSEHAEPESGPTSNPEHAEPESGPTSNPEHASIVARDLTLVNVAEIVVMCFEGRKIYSWGAAIELGYAYGCGKRIVVFNLSDEDTYFFMKYLPQDANHEVYIIEDKQSLKKFTQEYKPEGHSQEKVDKARRQLEEVLY